MERQTHACVLVCARVRVRARLREFVHVCCVCCVTHSPSACRGIQSSALADAASLHLQLRVVLHKDATAALHVRLHARVQLVIEVESECVHARVQLT